MSPGTSGFDLSAKKLDPSCTWGSAELPQASARPRSKEPQVLRDLGKPVGEERELRRDGADVVTILKSVAGCGMAPQL